MDLDAFAEQVAADDPGGGVVGLVGVGVDVFPDLAQAGEAVSVEGQESSEAEAGADEVVVADAGDGVADVDQGDEGAGEGSGEAGDAVVGSAAQPGDVSADGALEEVLEVLVLADAGVEGGGAQALVVGVVDS